MNAQPPILKLENLSKRYGDHQVLQGISLEIAQGEIKALIGPSGGGKSTLLHCINFLVQMDEGRIWLRTQEITADNKQALYAYRQRVGMIFQDFNLFDHLNALHNIQIGLVRVRKMDRAAARKRALAELERVGLQDHSGKYPAELSGGQKQRVSIARALAMDPEIMLLDEPTSSLDPELTGEVLAVIRDLANRGMTMILVTHQVDFAGSLADEILFMERGRIVERGAPQKILFSADCERTREFCAKIQHYTEDSVK